MDKDEFRKMRRAARLTQEQMGKRLGYSRQAVIAWERGDHAIPDDVLDKLIERSLAPTPEPQKPITPATHPALYRTARKDEYFRNEKHPHWFAMCNPLRYHLSKAQDAAFMAMVAYPADIERMQWTPARAIAFMVSLNVPEMDAQRIARGIGFDVPDNRDPYIIAQEAFFKAHPTATVDDFIKAHPQFREAAPESTGLDPELKAAFDNAFNLKTPGE